MTYVPGVQPQLVAANAVWIFERALQCFDLWSSLDPAELPGWETAE